MNKWNKITLVLITLVAHTSWAMLTSNKFGTFSDNKIAAIPSVLDRSFYEHQKMLERLNREQGVLYTQAKQFSFLKKDEQDKVVNGLSKQEKSMILKKMDDVSRYQFLFNLFNENKKATDFYCKQDPEAVMNRYSNANRLMKDYPINLENRSLSVHHYMVLTEEQIKQLSDMCNERRFFNRKDVEKFQDVFTRLQEIDPQLKYSQSLSDSIKLHPSVSERVHCFWKAQSYRFGSLASFMISQAAVVIAGQPLWIFLIKRRLASAVLDQKNEALLPTLKDHLEYIQGLSSSYPFTKGLLKVYSPLFIASLLPVAISKFCSYKNDIKEIICKNPSLTDALTDALTQVPEINEECLICCLDGIKLINIPCNGGKHDAQICQECCLKSDSLCPLCRGQLRDLSKLDSIFKA